MGLFDDLVAFLKSVEDPKEERMNTRKRFTAAEARALRKEHPAVPEDFVAYLREVGSGSLRECTFVVYGSLGTPDDILGSGILELNEPTTRVLCFGDYFSGDLSAFLPDEGWTVADIWHDSGRIYRRNQAFGEFIRNAIGIGEEADNS